MSKRPRKPGSSPGRKPGRPSIEGRRVCLILPEEVLEMLAVLWPDKKQANRIRLALNYGVAARLDLGDRARAEKYNPHEDTKPKPH